MNAVEIKNLTKKYKDGPTALEGVGFSIPVGETFGLLGPNGAGKTTLINILAGVTQKTSGDAKVHGKDIDDDPVFVKKSLGVVPQEMGFNPFFTVQQALELQLGYYGKRKDPEYIDYLLKKLTLFDKKNVKPRKLSGGMQRRFMIARALVHQPKVVVLDEPTAGVDVELRRQLYSFIGELKAQGITIILTTHYLEEAELLADRVAIINHGKIVALETVQEIRDRHKHLSKNGETPSLEDVFVHLTKGQV
ncbi:MAG: ABC transporter ATP-binding protein [bacterium]|nr:ABC transporter ATP-binding protein [bacterium]